MCSSRKCLKHNRTPAGKNTTYKKTKKKKKKKKKERKKKKKKRKKEKEKRERKNEKKKEKRKSANSARKSLFKRKHGHDQVVHKLFLVLRKIFQVPKNFSCISFKESNRTSLVILEVLLDQSCSFCSFI